MLSTERLWLKPYSPDMAPDFWQLLHQNRHRLQPDFPDRTKAVQTPADAENRIKIIARQRASGDLYSFGLWRKREGDYVGDITLRRLARGKHFCEVGYYLGQASEGQGLATEALLAVVQFAFQVLRMECVNIRCADGNDRSRKVAERCGFTFSKTYTPIVNETPDRPLRPIHVYRMLRTSPAAAGLWKAH